MSTVETQIEKDALKGRSGLSRYLAKRQIKKQSVAAIRASTAAKPQEGGQSLLEAVVGKNLDKSAEDKSSAFFIPSIYNTFSSLYLRRLFLHVYLDTALTTSEMGLWDAFYKFYEKYVSMDNEQLVEEQGNMLKDINELCDKYKSMIPQYEKVKEKAKNQKILFPHFFRPVEMEIYGSLHAEYENFLRKAGWK